MRDLDLIMAVLWLVFGIGLFVWEDLDERANQFRVPAAYLCMIMTVYRVVRWRLRAMRRRQETEQSQRPRPPKEVLHPEFDFSKEADENQDKP